MTVATVLSVLKDIESQRDKVKLQRRFWEEHRSFIELLDDLEMYACSLEEGKARFKAIREEASA